MFHKRHWFGPHSPMFERGGIKVLILEMLKEKPRHGYEIIKELEDKSFGFYSPSPGSVYPTLQWLEEMGYVSFAEQNGKKIYAVTEEGLKFYEENKKHHPGFEHFKGKRFKEWDEAYSFELHNTFHSLKQIGRILIQNAAEIDSEKFKSINALLERTLKEVSDILKT